jgi:hypothetical protein
LAVFLSIMLQMASLAEHDEVARAVVRWVMIAVSRCEHDARGANPILEVNDHQLNWDHPPCPGRRAVPRSTSAHHLGGT